jgi:hypothetical protein
MTPDQPTTPDAVAEAMERLTFILNETSNPELGFAFAAVPHSDLRRVLAQLAALQFQLVGYQHEHNEAGQVAGKALGYPWFKDDQKNFPDATEADGVCIGEHTNLTIVEELSAALSTAQTRIDDLESQLEEMHRKDQA